MGGGCKKKAGKARTRRVSRRGGGQKKGRTRVEWVCGGVGRHGEERCGGCGKGRGGEEGGTTMRGLEGRGGRRWRSGKEGEQDAALGGPQSGLRHRPGAEQSAASRLLHRLGHARPPCVLLRRARPRSARGDARTHARRRRSHQAPSVCAAATAFELGPHLGRCCPEALWCLAPRTVAVVGTTRISSRSSLRCAG